MENESIIRDLNLNETEEAEIKGGPKRIFIGGLSVAESALPNLGSEGEVIGGTKEGAGTLIPGGTNFNHNETTVADESETEDEFLQFADLNLTDEQLAEVKGGPSGWCTQCGGIYSNHNETVSSDDSQIVVGHLLGEDLAVPDAEAIKGGGKLPPPTIPISAPPPPRK